MGNPRSTTEPSFELVEELRIGRVEGVGPDVFGQIRHLAVDAAGRIYVLDYSAGQVRAFGPGGGHLWTAGREGVGPGELSYPVGMTIDDRGRIWVADAGKGRYVLFSEDGEFVEERRRHVVSGVVPWSGGFDRSGRLWEGFDAYPPGIAVALGLVGLDSSLVPVDSLTVSRVEEGYFRERDGSWSVHHIPFMPWVAYAFDPRGYVFSGDAGRYSIEQLTLAGDTIRVFELDRERVRVEAAERDTALAELDDLRRNSPEVDVDASLMPRVKPAFEAIYVGTDGRVWTYLHARGDALSPGPRETRLDVFGPDGVHQGVARVRSRLEAFEPTPVFTATHAYAASLDDLGIQSVVRLRIEPRR